MRRVPRRRRAGTACAGARPVHTRITGAAADRPCRRRHDDERLFGRRGQRRGRPGRSSSTCGASALVTPRRRRGPGRRVRAGDVRRERDRHRRAGASVRRAAERSRMVEWPYVGADQNNSRYSALDDITAANVDRLAIAWRWRPDERPLKEFGTVPGNFTSTPIMIDNVVYVTSNYNRVAALEAETGAVKWVYDPRAYEIGMPLLAGGFRHRGVADVAGCAGRQQAANLPREPLPALQPRRRDRQAGGIVRPRRHGRHQQGPELADRVVALRDQRRADHLQGPRDPRQRDRRQPPLQEDAARRRARLSRANRQAGMAVVVDSAVADRRRRRDLGERVVARRRADRDLARRDGRREARAGLSPDGKSRQPVLRRRASGRQPVRRDADRAGRRNRRPPLALSSSSTTASGTIRCPRRRC